MGLAAFGAENGRGWFSALRQKRAKSGAPGYAQISTNDREALGAALGHDVLHTSTHVPEMKPEQKQEQAVTPQREIAPKQEQREGFGLGL